VSSARFDEGVKPGARSLLETTYNLLHRLEDKLILEEVRDNVDGLKKAGAELEGLAGEMRTAVKKLEAIAEMIEKAAKAVGILAEVAAKVASSGLA
jgi:hypothetical protein